MAKLLHLETSPRKDRSVSIAVAEEFLDAYRTAHPGDEIETWDLWAEPLPEFDGAMLHAKYAVMHGHDHSDEQAAAWKSVNELADRFKAADKYLISLPMWNFGIPYKLKHLIDLITQPGVTFEFSPDTGYTGLVTGRPVAVAYARGGAYLAGTDAAEMDYQQPYLELWLRFIGFTDIHPLVAEPTAAPPEQSDPIKAAAKQTARDLAERF